VTARVRAYHARLPGYAPTPLAEVPALAAELGVGRVFVKDESARLGLPAFKVLGASWAVRQVRAGPGPDGAAPPATPPPGLAMDSAPVIVVLNTEAGRPAS
jgi:diaminopropionate ammonia-lyase